MASDTQHDGFCLVSDLLGNKGSMFLARVTSADFALLLKCPFITRITRKQGGQGSRHAALQVTVTKSSKSKLQVLSAGNYRKRTPKKAQAVHGPPLVPIPFFLGFASYWGACDRTAVPSLPPMLQPVRGCPGVLWGTAQHAGLRGLEAMGTGCWKEPATCRGPWPKPHPVTWRASQGVPSAEGESTGH